MRRSNISTRFFELRRGCLRAPTLRDVAIVGSMMLWPNDEEQRRRSMTAFDVDIALQFGQPETPAEHREFIDLVRTVPRPEDYQEQTKRGFRNGMIAGQILGEAVARSRTSSSRIGITTIKRRIASKLADDQVSVSTIDNQIWKNYRCVAACWAAYLTKGDPGGNSWLPCKPADLGAFLALSNQFRGQAERLRLPHASILLLPGETILVPSGITLPACALYWRAGSPRRLVFYEMRHRFRKDV